MRIPKLWRKKRPGGRLYGSWLATIAGEDVNLGTSNAELARQRLVEALRGKRNFPSDAELAAQALEAEIAPPAAPAPEPAPIPDPPAAAPAAAPVVPDAIEPPRALPPMPATAEADARAEAEATNAAAAETGGAPGSGEAPPAEGMFSADALEGMLATAASALVEAQLALQAFVIEKRTGKRPPALPEQLVGPLRTAAAQGWVAQFKRWFPDMADTPPWLIAVGAPLLLAPLQMAAAEPVKKPDDPAPAQAAA